MQSSSIFTVGLSKATEPDNMLHICTKFHTEMCTEGWWWDSLGTVHSTRWSNYPNTEESSTQAKFPREETAFHIWGCTNCLGCLAEAERDGILACRMFALVGDLHYQVKELQEDDSKLCHIRGDRKEINCFLFGTLQHEATTAPK